MSSAWDIFLKIHETASKPRGVIAIFTIASLNMDFDNKKKIIEQIYFILIC
jgi:hypothetical protein